MAEKYSMAFTKQEQYSSFKEYLSENPQNKKIFWIAGISIIIQFSVFKYFYPFASYIHGDSFAYLETALQNLPVNSYMVGYSMFLRMFSVFSNSDLALTAFQYLLIQTSSLFFLLTLFYFYRPEKVMRFILLGFMILNPLFLYLGNLVSSDALFLAISFFWFSILIWIIHKPSPRLIVWHTLTIYIAFIFRYNALIYMLIATVAFLVSTQKPGLKYVGIFSGTLVIGLFILYTGNEYKKITGIWQYSPFAGWLAANNAMYTYRYVDPLHRKSVPNKFKKLDGSIRAYFDSTRDTKKYPLESYMASTVYMWSPGLPLYNYKDSVFRKDSNSSELKRWASLGPLYKEYGQYIIRQYPGYYARYFLWPNGIKYYAPPTEFLSSYNSGRDSVNPIAQAWFHYKSSRVKTRTKNLSIELLEFYPIFSGMINVIMLFGLVSFAVLGGSKQNSPFRKGLLLGATVWVLNAVFTIVASPAALRFQSFPILLTATFSGLLIDWMWLMANEKRGISKHVSEIKQQPLPV